MHNPLRLIRARLTLWHVLSLAVLLALFSIGVWFALRYQLEQNLDATIEGRASVLLQAVEIRDGVPILPDQFTTPAIQELDPDGDDDDDDWEEEDFIRLYDRDGNLVLDLSDRDERVPVQVPGMGRALEGDEFWFDVSGDDEHYRVLVVPVGGENDVTGVLVVGQTTEEISDTLESLVRTFLVAYPLSLLTAAAIGLFLAQRALGPIDRMTRSVQRISAEDLGQRLNLNLPDDELGRLARTFDDMLARLENEFRRQRQFTADASHELRTPLTIMKGAIEVALSREREASAYRDVLQTTGDQVNGLIDLVNSLLLLARADAGQIPIQREDVDVPLAVETALDQLRPLSDRAAVALSSAGPEVSIPADFTLFLQLLFNLLENAVKHTPTGGSVQVSWSVEPEMLQLNVADTGDGISPEHLPHIFDRFYRVDSARTSSDGGAGIGLSICRWIVESHGGAITATSEPGQGSTFTVMLPLE
jgi:heavy metal sensor kinase